MTSNRNPSERSFQYSVGQTNQTNPAVPHFLCCYQWFLISCSTSSVKLSFAHFMIPSGQLPHSRSSTVSSLFDTLSESVSEHRELNVRGKGKMDQYKLWNHMFYQIKRVYILIHDTCFVTVCGLDIWHSFSLATNHIHWFMHTAMEASDQEETWDSAPWTRRSGTSLWPALHPEAQLLLCNKAITSCLSRKFFISWTDFSPTILCWGGQSLLWVLVRVPPARTGSPEDISVYYQNVFNSGSMIYRWMKFSCMWT